MKKRRRFGFAVSRYGIARLFHEKNGKKKRLDLNNE
jgi:hypothetical protein